MSKERELDAMIAEHVLGHDVIRQKKGGIKERTRVGHLRPLRAYSSEVNAAWEVADRLHISLFPVQGDQWFAIVGQAWTSPAEFFTYLQKADFVEAGAAVAAEVPMAICLAALKATEKRTGIRLITADVPRPAKAIAE